MSDIIIYLVVVFFLIGAIDKILDNQFGFGERFTDGLMKMGSLALATIGIILLRGY